MADPWEKFLKDVADQGGSLGDLAHTTLKQITQPGAPEPNPPVAPSSPSDAPEKMILIPLDKLEKNPFQPRNELEHEELERFTEGVRAQGLITPISVRKTPKGFQIISGHRRVEAFAQLKFNAATDEEEKRYSAIPAIVCPNVSDEQMMFLSLAENLQRSSLSPLEIAMALKRIRELYPERSIQDISVQTGLPPFRVKRFLQLAGAPAVVQAGTEKGIMVPAEKDPDDLRPENEKPSQKRHTLDLMGALEFARLHAFFVKKHTGQDAQQQADAKTEDVIKHALQKKWGFRDIQRYVDQTIGANNPAERSRGRPRQPFKNSVKQLVIYYDRLPKLSAQQKAALKKILEPLWKTVSEAS